VAAISEIHNVWRDRLQPASFRGRVFHVETSGRKSGRRTVIHQYPKRNVPYAEDMGRDAIRWSFTAYLIHGDHGLGNVIANVNALIRALEDDDAGMLVHPTLGSMLCMCDSYSYSDQRQRGGYFEFDMGFVEAGSPALVGMTDATAALNNAATNAENAAVNSINSALGGEATFAEPPVVSDITVTPS